MYYNIYTIKRTIESVSITNVSDKVANVGVTILPEFLLHSILLKFITAEDNQLFWMQVSKYDLR